MTRNYEAAAKDETDKTHASGELAFADMTDQENDEFVYLL
jgi:hypothetical protein